MTGTVGLDQLPEAVVVVGPDGAIRAMNDRASSLLGVEDSAVGRPADEVLDLRDPDDAPLRPWDAGPQDGGGFADHVVTAVGPWGRRAMDLSGRWSREGLVLTARTADRGTARASDHARLVAALAHDLRSPLASVKGFTRTLLRRWDGLDDDRKLALLQTIDADADRLALLLRQLVEVARLDADEVELRRDRVDVAALVREVVSTAEGWTVAEGRSVTVELPETLPVVTADRDRIELALTNLLDNALRHAPGAAVSVAVDAVPAGVRVRVRDAGPGIPAGFRERAFERLVRGPDAAGPGAGLGLHVARGLVAAHGGTLELGGDGPGGTTVDMVLPFEPGSGAVHG